MKLQLGRTCLAALALAIGVLAPPAWAQAVYGSIAGTVDDASGAAVPGATVTIKSVERQTEDTVITNESGRYTKDRLLPGTYAVRAELSGFKPKVVSRVVVNVDTQTMVNFALEVGALTEEVTVTSAEGQTLKTDRADVAVTFENKQLTELPVLDRNFTKFILLTPGTQQQSWNHAASENPQGSAQTVVNGQTFSGTGYQLDGTENRDPILGIIVINPNLEAIGETKITSQNYDAEFGQAIAGVVSVQTKSGTNELHGSAFEFLQRDNFQARNPYSQFQEDPLTGRFLPESKRDQFGGSIGGPIVKNEWFFFGDYQGTRSNVGGSRLLTVPTAAARNGDLSAYGVNIFDPTTGAPDGRAQFPGNVIPSDRLSPQALAVLDLIPLPNAPGSANGTRDNYVASGSEKFNNDSFNVRLDGRLSESLNIFGRYSYAKYDIDGPQAFGAGGGQELVSLGGKSKVRNHSVALGTDITLNATTILDVRLGFFKYGVDVLPNDFGTTPAADAGIPGVNLDDFSSGLPFFELNGGTAQMRFGSGLDAGRCNCPLAEHEKQFQFVTNLTKAAGNHTIKFGVDIRRAYNLRVPSDSHRSGQFYFDADGTRGSTGGGMGLATFLLGNVQRLNRYTSTSTDARETQWREFFYIQDTWRATDKLTLNYGLRTDIINPQAVNEPGNGGWLDINTGEIRVGGVGDINLQGNVENKINWAPRLGVTYQLNPKTVLRAGYGRSYDIGVFGSTFGHSVTQNLPVLSAQSLNPPANFLSVFNLDQGPPAPTFVDVPANGRFPLPNGTFARLLPDQQNLSHVDAYNVTIQRQLTENLSAEIAYVGNRGEGFFGDNPATDTNSPTIQGFGTIPRDLRRPFFAGLVPTVDGLSGAYGWTQNIDYFSNTGKSRYNSFQAKLTRRFSGGYSLLTHYTYQDAKNNSGEYFFIDPDVNYGPADFIRTHVFVLAANADLPFGRGRRWLSDAEGATQAIFGNWQFNTNVTIQSGLPFNVDYRDSGSDRDVGPNRPDLIGDPQTGSGDGITSPYYNVTPIGTAGSAFGRPARGTFGSLPRNELRGPGFWNVDASLFKRFPLGGAKSLEFRVEAQNVFNHINDNNPDGNIGVPGNNNPSAGFITSMAPNALPRNLQFALRFQF
ncbi:MAG TPA: TonB-dependent receptor [Vicinamibacteria bacterium]|nr:TonB-dependent receptor [Vicinamibacteria bacterium]